MNQVRNPLSEALSASFAGERSLSAMNALMILQGGEFFESPTALATGVGFVVSMVKHVLVVRLLKSEGLATDMTSVWCFARVQPLVFLQKILGGEGFFADIALPLLVVMHF